MEVLRWQPRPAAHMPLWAGLAVVGAAGMAWIAWTLHHGSLHPGEGRPMLFWAGAILSSLAVWAALGVAATTFGLPLGRALAYAGAVHLGFGILSPIVSGGSLATIHLTRLLLWPFQLFAWLGISWGLLPPPP